MNDMHPLMPRNALARAVRAPLTHYQLDAFAQNGKVLPTCPRSFAEALQNQISLGTARIAQGLPEGDHGRFGTRLAFQTSRKVRDIVVCAYSRMVDDDAAVSALRFKLRRR